MCTSVRSWKDKKNKHNPYIKQTTVTHKPILNKSRYAD